MWCNANFLVYNFRFLINAWHAAFNWLITLFQNHLTHSGFHFRPQVASEHAQQAASEAAAELASQTQMVGAAKARVENIEEQLNSARVDFEATQEAAHKAASSAQEAQNNAAEAAAHAAISHRSGTVAGEHQHQHQHNLQHQLQHQIQAKAFNAKGAHQQGDDINSAEQDAPSNHKFNDFKPASQSYNYPGYK